MSLRKSEFRVPYSPRGSIFGSEELEAVRTLLNSPATLSCGEQRSAFEREFASHLGVDPGRAVATSNCTVALELATHVIALRPGENVVVTPQSYQATINPLLALDVEVRFGDIDAGTLCLDPARLASLIDAKTRAIFITHYGGLMVDMNALEAVTIPNGIAVVEDCAHAHGSKYMGVRAGASGHFACFSFQSMKNMSTLGQGGMLIAPDTDLAARLRRLVAVEPDATFAPKADRGVLGAYRPCPPEVFSHDKNAFDDDCVDVRRHGTNATLSEPAAAVGRVQLRRLPGFLARRRTIAEMLDEGIRRIEGLRPQETPPGWVHSHHLYTCFVEPGDPERRDRIAAALIALGVEVQQRYFPLHLLPEWRLRGGRPGLCPVAETIWFESQLNLPIYPLLTDEQVAYMIAALHSAVEQEALR